MDIEVKEMGKAVSTVEALSVEVVLTDNDLTHLYQFTAQLQEWLAQLMVFFNFC